MMKHVVRRMDTVETEMYIDRKICMRRVQKTQMNVTKALATYHQQCYTIQTRSRRTVRLNVSR
jgi:hypothetical protein